MEVIEIKSCWSGEVLYSGEHASLREAVEAANLGGADLGGANLYGANLYGANLYGANLYGADLYGADLEGEILTRSPLQIDGLHYRCLITEGYLRLGCKRFTHAEWAAFDDAAIRAMDSHALEFWAQWKAPPTDHVCRARRKYRTRIVALKSLQNRH